MNNASVYAVLGDDTFLDRARIAKAVQDVFEIAHEERMLDDGDTGGVVLVGWHVEAHDASPTLIGEFHGSPPEVFSSVAMEKYSRLYQWGPDRNKVGGHISAWQSRDVSGDYKKYGGAIVAGGFILSFSGLSEYLDEAIVTVAAHLCGLIDQGQMFEIAVISNNPLTAKLCNAVSQRLRR